MRTFSGAVNERLLQKTGLEPVIFIGIQWGDLEVFYCTTDFPGTRKTILSISGLETTQKLTGSGVTQSVSVTLSDTDGGLTSILNSIDVHKRPAKVYLGFPDVPIAASVTLLDGEINSEMVWDERSRSFSFSILSKIEGRLFGFAVENGLFPRVDSRSRSTPWPFRFGETCARPAVSVRNGVSGFLQSGQGVLNATLNAQICQAESIICPLIEDPHVTSPEPEPNQLLSSASNQFSAGLDEDLFTDASATRYGSAVSSPQSRSQFITKRACADYLTSKLGPCPRSSAGLPLVPDRDCERAKFQTLCQLLRDRANQLIYVSDTLSIVGGENFPQNQVISVRVSDVVYTGIMTDRLFTIHTTNDQGAPTENAECVGINELGVGYRQTEPFAPTSLSECEEPTNTWQLRVVGGAGEAWRALGKITDGKFKWLPAGSEAHLETSSIQVHVVSLVPGTVDAIYAYRTFGDTKQLTELPTDYYEIVTTNYGGLSAVEIHLVKPLSSYQDEKWEDRLYVQFTSDVGPSPVDVIEWIVDRYTDFTVDSANFTAIKALLTNYPCNYYHAKKTNVINVLEQIAYEARCALTITDNVVKLTYLPTDPVAVKTFTGNDIVAGSFKFLHTRTEELVTSREVNWQPFGVSQLSFETTDRKFTIENNTQKYGYFGGTSTYDTITDEGQAIKTATFWSIRESNTWRIIRFQTTLEHMNLELFDAIEVNIAAFPSVKCVVSGMKIDPENGIVEFECWTPILSGTTEEYLWAWPSQQNPLLLYPDGNRSIQLPPIQISPPVGHPLYVADFNPPIPPTTGDRNPSDIDDELPQTACQDATDPVLIDAIQPVFDRIGFGANLDIAQQAVNADEKAVTPDGLNWGGGGEEESENYICGRPSFEDCVWEVVVGYATATAIGETTSCAGTDYSVVAGPCSTTKKGIMCTSGSSYTWCKTFGSEQMAKSFKDSIKGQIEAAFCSWRTGKSGPIYVIGPTKKAGTGSTCVGMGDVEVGNGSNQ